MHLQVVTRYFLPVRAGVETHCLEVAKKVAQTGHDVTVVTRDDGFGHDGPLPAEEVMEGFIVVRAPSNHALSKYINFLEPVYLNNFDMSVTFHIYAQALAHRLRGIRPKIWLVPHGGFTPYWDQFSVPQRTIKKLYHGTLGRLFINHLTCGVSALNEWEKGQLIRAGVRESIITVRTNGVEDIAFDLPSQCLQDHDLSWLIGARYLLMLCRISREKNIHQVIKALSKLEGLSLVIGGSIQDQEYYEEIRSLMAKEGLSDRVHFIGYVSGQKKYALIDGAEAVSLMSLYECDPIIVKEALARGRPIIASAVGPLPSLIADGGNGFLATPDDVESITSAIARMLALTSEGRQKMQEDNKKKAIRYRWETVTKSLIGDISTCEGR